MGGEENFRTLTLFLILLKCQLIQTCTPTYQQQLVHFNPIHAPPLEPITSEPPEWVEDDHPSTQSVSNFLTNKSIPTADDDKATAAEGTWAYHTARHHQSFASTDCVSSEGLFRTMFSDSKVAMKFSSAQKETAKIITGVLAPWSVERVLQELGDLPFSISIDASNHKEKKLFPFVIRQHCYVLVSAHQVPHSICVDIYKFFGSPAPVKDMFNYQATQLNYVGNQIVPPCL